MPDAPQTAQQAGKIVHDCTQRMKQARATSQKLGKAARWLNHLYNKALRRALIGIEGRNAEERDAKAHKTDLDDETRRQAIRWGEEAGLDYIPATVEDLEFMAGLADDQASSSSASAYDARSAGDWWQSVTSWAKAEYRHTFESPQEGVGT